MRLLIVSEWFPYPPIAGAKIHAYNLIRQLARGAEIDLVAAVHTLSPEQVAAGTSHLKQFCSSVGSGAPIPYRYGVGKALRVLVDPVLAVGRYTHNRGLEALLAARLVTRYDAVIASLSGAPGSTLLSLVKLGARPLIADDVELGVLRPKPATPLLRRARNEYTWRHLRRFTHGLLQSIDVIRVTSENERRLFADLVRTPDQCVVIPNVIDPQEYAGDFGPREFNRLLYAGSFGYIANYEAMLWFTQQVFGRIPGGQALEVIVTGNTAGRDLRPLQEACPQIQFPGFVDDIRPYFAQSGICIVPILAGGSTRLKIIEAMAWGTPVVSTRIGAEGLEVTHEQNILLADTPEDFAAGIGRLLNDRALWQRLSAAGRALVAARYSADAMYRQYRDILARVARPGQPPVQGSVS